MADVIDVGLNLLWLRPGRVGGTESYAMRVIRALLDHAPDLRLHTVCSSATREAHGDTIGRTMMHQAPGRDLPPPLRVVLERTWLQRQKHDLSVMHHLGGTVPPGARRPTVVTVHDLQPIDQPSNFSMVKQRWLERAIPAAVHRADVVVTPSDWVGATIVDRYGLDPARVVTVSAYAGVGVTAGSSGCAEQVSPGVRELLRRAPVIVYPAMTMAHKNHITLFDAFQRAAASRPDLALVCVGSIGRDHDEILAAAARTSERIHVLGRVAQGDIVALLSGAELLVFPSRYEGFGLPVLEAQSLGTPVVVSTAGALPEVSGDGAIRVDPDDVEGWADVLRTPLAATDRVELIERGRMNNERYTPEKTAAAQTRAYRIASANS